MGGLCKSDAEPKVTHSSVVSGTDIPEWVSKGGQELFEQSKILAQEEYPLYGGPRVAETSQDEQTAYGLVRSGLGAFKPYTDKATAMTEFAGSKWTPETAQEYMNPYQKNVTDIAAQELLRNAGIRNRDLGAASPQFGAFGSARHGVLEAENERNLQKEVGELYAKGQAAAYENAATRFNQDRAAAGGAGQQMGALGQLLSGLNYTDADVLMRSGEQQRGQDQRNLDTAYGDFLEQREWPYRQVNFATGVLKGVPFESQTTQTSQNEQLVAQPSTLGQVGGLALTGAALGNMAGWWG